VTGKDVEDYASDIVIRVSPGIFLEELMVTLKYIRILVATSKIRIGHSEALRLEPFC
jgi:hypothetical protein